MIIEGKIHNGSEKKLIIQELRIKETITLDSLIINHDGSFRFKIPVEEMGFFLIKAGKNNFISLVAGPGEHIRIDADYDNLSASARINGSESTVLYRQFEMLTIKNLKKVDSLGKVLLASQHLDNFADIRKQLDSEYSKIAEEHKNEVSLLVKQAPSSLASLLMINRWFGKNPVFEMERDSLLYYLVDSALMSKYPSNKHVREFHEKILELRESNQKRSLVEATLVPGNISPDIRLPDPAGKIQQLSALVGKPVILYFWNSISETTPSSLNELNRLYLQSGNKKFEVFAVFCGESRNQWEQTIKSEKMKWVNVSDLKGLSSPIAARYNLNNNFPILYLLDKEGKIVGKSPVTEEILASLKKIW